MFFKQRLAEDASLSYFLGCAGKGSAIAVDVVAGDEAWFIEQVEKVGVRLTHVIDTHIHADHYSGGRHLANLLGAEYALHASAEAQLHFAFCPLIHGQVLDVGNVVVKVIHTPGHTPESICLLITDQRRSTEPWFLLTGDTLFVGAVGRPDLLGEEKRMAEQLYDSLHNQLLILPDTLEIFPGHQAGSLCGAGLSGKPSSTLGFEKQWNSMLSLEKQSFVEQLLAQLPERPTQMNEIVAANISA